MNPRIFGAFLVGAGLISVAYFLAPTTEPTAPADASASAVTGPAPAREPIRILDSDNDGIADWQEPFRRTNPVAVNETALTSSEENYTPPETLTGRLAIDLLSGTIQSDIRGPFGQDQDDLINHAQREIENAAEDEPYLREDITIINDSSPEVLRVYGNRVADINRSTVVPPDTRSELEVIEHALRSDDESLLAELDPRIDAYERLLTETLAVEVPVVVAEEHLSLLNAYNSLYKNIEGMRQAFDDPLYTMVRLKRYYNDAVMLNAAIVELYTKLYEEGARFEDGDRALDLVTIEE